MRPTRTLQRRGLPDCLAMGAPWNAPNERTGQASKARLRNTRAGVGPIHPSSFPPSGGATAGLLVGPSTAVASSGPWTNDARARREKPAVLTLPEHFSTGAL